MAYRMAPERVCGERLGRGRPHRPQRADERTRAGAHELAGPADHLREPADLPGRPAAVEEHQRTGGLECTPLAGVGNVAWAQRAAVKVDQRSGFVCRGVVAGEVEHTRHGVEQTSDLTSDYGLRLCQAQRDDPGLA